VTRLIALAAAAAPFALMAPFALIIAPAQAQDAPVGGVVTIYGNDECPADTVCIRGKESDRFRIPKELREAEPIARENQSWAVRQESAMKEGATGTGSCSTVGAGGATGCFVKEATIAKAEYRQRRDAARNLPLP
jgi:hypothetical protein